MKPWEDCVWINRRIQILYELSENHALLACSVFCCPNPLQIHFINENRALRRVRALTPSPMSLWTKKMSPFWKVSSSVSLIFVYGRMATTRFLSLKMHKLLLSNSIWGAQAYFTGSGGATGYKKECWQNKKHNSKHSSWTSSVCGVKETNFFLIDWRLEY